MRSCNDFIRRMVNKLPEETIVENERGISLFGIPIFSPRFLINRIDPTHWQIIDDETSSLKNIGEDSLLTRGELYPLTQSHKDEKWFVLMDFGEMVDMDDQGWLYSWRFNSPRWKSKHGFVRRRIWVKKSDLMAEKVVSSQGTSEIGLPFSSESPTFSITSMDNKIDICNQLVFDLKRQILDRKRFELLDEFLRQNLADEDMWTDDAFVRRLSECFEFKTSKVKFQQSWLPHALNITMASSRASHSN